MEESRRGERKKETEQGKMYSVIKTKKIVILVMLGTLVVY